MTAADQSATLDGAQFAALFDRATRSVFRLEGHQHYGNDPAFDAWSARKPRPERSVRTSPWLRRIAAQAARDVDPVDWTRVRIVTQPVTDYTRYELLTYMEAQTAGERVRIVEQDGALEVPADFWLIDAGTDSAVGVRMDYDPNGALLARVLVEDPHVLEHLAYEANYLRGVSAPLNHWLPGSGIPLLG